MSGRRKKRAQKEAGDAKNLMIDAIRKGSLSNVKKLVHSHGSSCFDGDNVGNSLIYDAIKLGHADIAKYLLQNGVKVDREGDRTDTLLHLAIKQQHEELVRLLLGKNVQIDARNAENETPLHLAAKNGDSEIVGALLDSNASVTAQTTGGATPLLLAAEGRHEEVVEMLLKHASANVSTSSEKKDLPLLNRILLCTPSACDRVDKLVASIVTLDYRQSRIVEELAEHGFIPSRGYVNKALLSAAVEKNYVKLVKNILMSGDILDDFKSDPLLLHCAVEERHREMVELLLSSGFDADAKNKGGQTCLSMMSCYFRSDYWKSDECVEMIRLLLANGADMKEAPHFLHRAAEYGLVEVCKLLIDNGADLNALNEYGRTSLYLSCVSEYDEKRRQYRDEIVRLLLEKGADGNIKRPSDGWTALHWAVRCGRKEAVSILIQFGVDVDPLDNNNRTPLHWATERGHKDIVQMLCENKASVDARDKYGQTPLHCAALEGKADVVEVLIMFADIDSRDDDGSTPLHYACNCYGNKETVKMLCENGASVDSRRNDGQTPLHYAAYYGNADKVEVLLNFGADINARVAASEDEVNPNNGCTPLLLAAKRNRAGVVETLVKFGCDLHARGPNNETALHCAFSGDRYSWSAVIVTTLLDEGIDVNAVDRGGNTALDCAISILKAKVEECQRSGRNIAPRVYPDHILNSSSLEAIDALKRHLIKLKAAGLYVRDIKEELRQFDYSKPAHSEFQAQCEEEVKRLKSERVSPDHTLHAILVSGKKHSFARNESLIQKLSSFDFDPFPIYRSLITGNLRRSKQRFDLIHSGQNWLNALIKTSNSLNEQSCPVLPEELSEWIVSYLNNPELKTLIVCGEALKRQVTK